LRGIGAAEGEESYRGARKRDRFAPVPSSAATIPRPTANRERRGHRIDLLAGVRG
jgi:hypothetical protein